MPTSVSCPASIPSNPGVPSGARLLLTGATGFVGRHLWPALEAAGYQVRGLTRDPEQARQRQPERDWVGGDIGDPEAVAGALAGCRAAFYLVHGMAEGDSDYRRREVESAQRFAEVAERVGVRRIIYLGGVAPSVNPSEHLRSRLEVGEALRSGSVPTLELRASMIVGYGSLSWLIVRDLAARLPVMVLPRWLNSRTQPVGIADVVAALRGALTLPLPESAWYDLPGPETLTGREILYQTAAALGLRRPWTIQVPLLAPWLSSYWVLFVTRAEWSVAREVVVGLREDLVAENDAYWRRIGHLQLQSFLEAARAALAEERKAPGNSPPTPSGFWGGVERGMQRYRGMRPGVGK